MKGSSLGKDWYKHAAAIGFFVVLVSVFFFPSVFEGKTLLQTDNVKAIGMGRSQMDQYKQTAKPGEFSIWSDTMFGGMPYVAGYGSPTPSLPSHKWLEKPFLLAGPDDAAILLIALVCFYILLCGIGANWWLAVAGAIAFAFASYNIIVIQVGHILKGYVIAYMPLTIAGMVYLFKRNYPTGALLLLLGVAFSISRGHIQITYYLFILCLFIYFGYLASQVKKKTYTEAGKVTGIMFACIVLAILVNTRKLYADWELGQQSTRGKTELTTVSSTGEKISSGLDKEYAFEWSYGKLELSTLLIPDAYGRSSWVTPDTGSQLYEAFATHARMLKDIEVPIYWGDKPSTAGPVYFGALICFLFVLGMLVIRNSMKWWLLAAALFFTFLALGRNMDWFNDIMFHYLPMYNKFRTVEMALVIPGLIVPLIAIWGLKDIFRGEVNEKSVRRAWLEALELTGGFCLMIWLLPDMVLTFRSVYDNEGLPEWFLRALADDRIRMASSDALRSFLFILSGAGLLFWYFKAKDKQMTATTVTIIMTILILIDLWMVDRRFIDYSAFSNMDPHQMHTASPADKAILKDKESFRVLNLDNTFEETTTSYYHHSVGGYYAAKLRRYEELIQNRLEKEIRSIVDTLRYRGLQDESFDYLTDVPSINMLNTRYIIYNPQKTPIHNPYAYGNAWFVNKIYIVENADEELAALDMLYPLEEAVIDKRFNDELEGFVPNVDSTASIVLTSYRPNRLEYNSSSKEEQLAVFSEIYYQPGWRAFIDGQPAPHFRADWILRAMRIPAGDHNITFEFYPETYVKAAYIETYSSFLLFLLVVGTIGYRIRKNGFY